MLLLFLEEEQAFWTFCVTVNDILPPNVYDVTMEGANIDQTILMMLLSERCPHLWNRVSEGKAFWDCEGAEGHGMPTTSLVTSHWFLTLFINILPTEVSMIISTETGSLFSFANGLLLRRAGRASCMGLSFLVSLLSAISFTVALTLFFLGFFIVKVNERFSGWLLPFSN